jgi:hypothetical protein
LDWLQAEQSKYVIKARYEQPSTASQLTVNSSKLSSIVSSSTDSTSNSSKSLGHAIQLECPAEDVCELQFSPINGLYVITKNRQTEDMSENVMSVFAWSLQGGRRTALSRSLIKHDVCAQSYYRFVRLISAQGKDDLLQGLFTCFASYNLNMAFTVVSEERRVITRAWELGCFTQSTARGYRLLQILLDHDDREVLAFGTREAHNELQLLQFPAANTGEDLKIKSGKKLPGMTHQSRFASAITSTSTSSLIQRYLLIAILEGPTVRIVRVSLDS